MSPLTSANFNPAVQQQMRFCAHYLIDHGIDTPAKFNLLVDSLTDTDNKYLFVKVVEKDEMFNSMATQLKQLWPTGTREINGKRYPWQDSVANLTVRLKQVWNSRELADKYTIDDVLKCARQYLSDYENNAKYMLSLPYWISKEKSITDSKGVTKKIYVSKMADLLESKTTTEETEDWTSVFSGYLGEGDLV